MSPKARGCVK